MTTFAGTLPALITPFRDGKVDEKALRDLVERCIAGGVDGLVPCGTTGESVTLSEAEHALVVRTVVEQAKKRVPVVAGAGTVSTAHTIHLAEIARDAKADGLLLVCPYYNRPTQAGLEAHFREVAKHVPLPTVLYNIPGRTGVEIAPETIARLHADLPNIQAVKHATGSVDGVSILKAISDIAILCGDDPLTLPMMSVGAVGVVSVIGNYAPATTSSLTRSALAGDWDAARATHDRIYPFMRDLLKLDINPIPIKTALALKGMMAEEFRLPMCPLDAAARTRLESLLKEHADIDLRSTKRSGEKTSTDRSAGRITHSVAV